MFITTSDGKTARIMTTEEVVQRIASEDRQRAVDERLRESLRACLQELTNWVTKAGEK